jgi:hypothetical protein
MYKLLKDKLKNEVRTDYILKITDDLESQVFIPFDPANTDYQQYLKFLEEGGQPLPADDNGQTS